MINSKFFRYKKDIHDVNEIYRVYYQSAPDVTKISYKMGNGERWTMYPGDIRDDLWELIRLAKKSNDEYVQQPEPTKPKQTLEGDVA